ncbi:MAG: hypothetical protein HZA37_02320 [Parcubacteria group bacterium]|nr:hypothetical protein [Parcubacteria group bacterium]
MDNFQTGKSSNEADVDVSIAKIVVLAVLAVGSAAFLGWQLKRLFDGSYDWITAFAALALFLVFFLLQALLIKNFGRQALVVFLESAAIFAFFYALISPTLLFGLTVVFGLFLWAANAGKKELENGMKIRFFRVGKTALSKAATALAVAIGIIYYIYAAGAGGFFLSKEAVRQSIVPVSGIIGRFIPGFTMESSVNDIIKNISSVNLENDSRFQTLPSEVRAQLIKEASSQLLKQLSDFLGVSVSGAEKIDGLLHKIAEDNFTKLDPNGKSAAFWIAAAAVALTFRGAAFLAVWAAEALAFLAYQFLIVSGAATIALESRSREIIVLK